MDSIPGQGLPDEEETGRELRVKILLLVFALVLVAGYAATMVDLGGTLRSYAEGALRRLTSPPGLAVLTAAFAALGMTGLLLARRRAAGRAASDPLAKADGRPALEAEIARQLEIHARTGRQFVLYRIRFEEIRDLDAASGKGGFLRLALAELSGMAERATGLARLADDEIAVVQPESGGSRQAELGCRRIAESLRRGGAQVPGSPPLAVSIGAAIAPGHGSDPAELLGNAGLALDAARRSGQPYRIFGRALRLSAEERTRTRSDILKGLEEGWFDLHFQPQYDLRSARLIGFEALLRMNHPERGELQPNAFLPVAEDGAIAARLRDWVLQEALATAANWPAEIKLSVNVSAGQLRQGDAADAIIQALRAAGLAAGQLVVETTEAALLDGGEIAASQLRRLHTAGIATVLDDFGLAGARLASLAEAALSGVKLDRSLVRRIGESDEAERLMRALMDTARAFGLTIAAEGVERAEQVRFLLAQGCPQVQGFLLGRPAHPRDVAAIIAKDIRKRLAAEAPGPQESQPARQGTAG